MTAFNSQYNNSYDNCRVFLTGATGFKGSWLTTCLRMLGAKIRGYSLDIPSQPNHFSLLKNDIDDCRGDVRNFEQLSQSVREFEPQIVFHLAAQPLVRASYDDPLGTLSTNIIGTANILQACRAVSSIRAVVIITSDKCYENKEWSQAYREHDSLGGHDPYSASKACAEIVTASFRRSFPSDHLLIASCRAGNVIGGGDWASDRLFPDLIRATINPTESNKNNKKNQSTTATTIRMPNAIRPWQHVLEPLHGYLLIGQKLLEGNKDFAEAWNFAPKTEGNCSVGEIVKRAAKYWDKINYQIVPNNNSSNDNKHEAAQLSLDSTKAQQRLAWQPVWTLERSIERTITWYKNFYEQNKIQTQTQIEEYIQNRTDKNF
ncbi:MAG: CDP-glucose 4,6-dehydratase [Planctomycetaceae bacterium]|jgi:CDP-glucose 4,6-dehydratase|nr:CDP-glucose 4,6-dehydratase [Planctomycetaceae bacterium]